MQSNYILVLNCGSSSVKFAIIEPNTEENILNGLVQCIGITNTNIRWRYKNEPRQEQNLKKGNYQDAFAAIVSLINDSYKLNHYICAIGHRVVHGGEHFTQAAIVNDKSLSAINVCCNLAPLHNPANVAGIEAAMKMFPNLPQVVVFDTAFHQTMPQRAYLYPVPYHLYEKNAVRRYGFHGISHQYVTQQAAKNLGLKLEDSAFICAHLGNGCSAAAVLNGASLDTSMGLTPLEGLMMGTRSGDVDPSLHAYLADNLGYDVHKVTTILNKESGLLGISGKYSDMREIETAIEVGDERALLAAEMFCYRLAKYIAALSVPLSRIDALLFTGGIGENSDYIRANTINLLKVLGFVLDKERNAVHGKNSSGIITQEKSPTKAIVIATNEELLIAQETKRIVDNV